MTMLEEIQQEIQKLKPEELETLRDHLVQQRKARMRQVLQELAANPMNPEEAAIFDEATKRRPWRATPFNFDE